MACHRGGDTVMLNLCLHNCVETGVCRSKSGISSHCVVAGSKTCCFGQSAHPHSLVPMLSRVSGDEVGHFFQHRDHGDHAKTGCR